MTSTLEEFVRQRAHLCCEYCLMPEAFDAFTHEIDHVIARKHNGPTVASNLALACFPCNNYKGPNLAGIDPSSRKITRLFHPRRHKWTRHFRWHGPLLIGQTEIGRATVDVLSINEPNRVLLRATLMDEGVFPPDHEL